MSHGGAFLHRAHRVFIHERVEKKVHCWRNRTRCCRRNRTRCCRRLAFSAQARRIILAKLAFWRQKSLLASRHVIKIGLVFVATDYSISQMFSSVLQRETLWRWPLAAYTVPALAYLFPGGG